MSSCSMACRLSEEDRIEIYKMNAICYMFCL
jgi:hypothetical protein